MLSSVSRSTVDCKSTTFRQRRPSSRAKLYLYLLYPTKTSTWSQGIICKLLCYMKCSTLLLTFCFCNVVEAHGYSFRSTVVSGEHSRSKTSAIIAMYDISTDVLYVTKTLVVETSYIAIIALVLLHECSPLTTVDSVSVYAHLYSNLNGLVPIEWLEVYIWSYGLQCSCT